MNGAFYVAATGLRAQEAATEATSNNVANWNTPGYKRTRARFIDLVASVSPASLTAQQAAGATEMVVGVRLDQGTRIFDPGALRATNNAADLAIDGQGFLEVLGPNAEILLWRGGRLKTNADGALATLDGFPLKAFVSVPMGATDVAINRQGLVTAKINGQEEQIGQIELTQAPDASALEPLGGGFFKTDRPDLLRTSAPGEDGSGLLAQGFEEGSNVQLSDEMVSLMINQRAFAANAQVLQAADQLMAISNSLRK